MLGDIRLEWSDAERGGRAARADGVRAAAALPVRHGRRAAAALPRREGRRPRRGRKYHL